MPLHLYQMSSSSDERGSQSNIAKVSKLQNAKGQPGQLVTFYKNGVTHFKGYETSVGKQYFTSMGRLKAFLSEKVPLDSGYIKYILALPYGDVVRDISEFKAGRGYVVSNSTKLTEIDYLKTKAASWDIRQPSGGRTKYKPVVPPVNRRPRILHIASNTNRKSCETFYLNEKTPQLYEEFLKDVQGSLDVESPPISALYTASPRHRKVRSFSHLQRDLKSVSEFIACGRELYPDTDAPYPKYKESKDHIQHGQGREENSRNDDVNGDVVTGTQIQQTKRQHGRTGSNSKTQARDDMKGDADEEVGDDIGDLSNDVSRDRYQTQTLTLGHSGQSPNNGVDDDSDISTPGSSRSVSTQTSTDPSPTRRARYRSQVSTEYVAADGDRQDSIKPDKDVRLEWVYGYRGRDTVNSLHMLPDGSLIYYVGAVVVITDRKYNQQRHYAEHTEDITCLALRDGAYRMMVATGQLRGSSSGQAAHIRVWDPVNMETLSIVGQSVFTASVCALGFTGSGASDDILFAVDESTHHVIRVWDWRQNKVLAKTMSSRETVVWGGFHPVDPAVLITLGRRHLYFWKVYAPQEADDIGQILRDVRSGNFPNGETPQYVTSLEFAPSGDVITGDSEGHMWLWARETVESPFELSGRCSHRFRNAHKGTVFALAMLEDGVLLSAADNCIKAWNVADDYSFIREVRVPILEGSIRALTPQVHGGVDRKLYVGTTGNDILEGTLRSHFQIIVDGHNDELTAVASVPGEVFFLTIGRDSEVRKWDSESHTCEWTVKMDKPGTSIAVDNLGRYAALGTSEGRLVVMNILDGRHVTSFDVGSSQINAIKYSPDNNYLAVGCENSNIYVYSVHNKGKVYRKHVYGVLQGHEESVTELDWSCDGRHLQSMAGTTFLYWFISNLTPVAGDTSRHIDWFTHTCVGGHSFSGADIGVEEDPNMVCTDRATSDDVMVVGDLIGAVRVYRYPTDTPPLTQRQAARDRQADTSIQLQGHHMHRIHSSRVCDVSFLYGDSHVISIGGLEGGVFQWRVIDV